jgi:hypothetical protein
MSRFRALPLVLAALAFAGCSEPTSPADALALNRARWRAHGSADYEFAFQRWCFCDRAAVARVQIRVEGGAVAAVIDTLGQPVDSLDVARYFTITIDSLFGVVEHAIALGADELAVRYHPELGYPESIVIDYIAAAVDEELQLEAGLLIPFSPLARQRALR